MIAGCIDRMRNDACRDCIRRDACAALIARVFGFSGVQQRREQSGLPRGPSPLTALLGEVAKAIQAHAAPRAAPVRREVERRIEPMLASGPVRIEEVAREMGLSRQTLYRRLKGEGTTFEAVLDGLRHRLALRMIRDEKVSVKEAAWRLGFSDPAAFSRAYKRWTGTSPRGPRQSG